MICVSLPPAEQVPTRRPEGRSKIDTSPAASLAATSRPSRLNSTHSAELTQPRMRTSCAVRRSHTLTVLSLDADARRVCLWSARAHARGGGELS